MTAVEGLTELDPINQIVSCWSEMIDGYQRKSGQSIAKQ